MKIMRFFLCSDRRQCFLPACLLTFIAVAVIFWPQSAAGQHPAVPKLTLAQVEELVSHGVPDSTMTAQIQRRGLAFASTAEIIESLRMKGAGPLTLEAMEAHLPKGTLNAATGRTLAIISMGDPGIYPFRVLSADGKTAKTGFVDGDGKVLIQPEWEEIGDARIFGQLVAFNEGLCSVRKNGKWGYIDTSGNLVIPTQFDLASPFVEGLAWVKLGSQYGYIDKAGRYVINPHFQDAGFFHEGLAAVRTDGGYGFINRFGQFVIKPQFDFPSQGSEGFSSGLAAVCLSGQCGYIDHNGTFVINPQFDNVYRFSDGMAAVRIGNKLGYVNATGKVIIHPQFQYAMEFSNGNAFVDNYGQSGTIDKQGRINLNLGKFELLISGPNGLAIVRNSDGVGVMIGDGKWVLKPSKALTNAGAIWGNAFDGKVGGKFVPISLSGKVLAGQYKGLMLNQLSEIDTDTPQTPH